MKQENRSKLLRTGTTPLSLALTVSLFVTGLLACVALSGYVFVDSREQQLLAQTIHEERRLFRNAVLSKVRSSIVALKQMAHRWEVSNGTSKRDWLEDARQHVGSTYGLTTIEWVDQNYRVRWIQPLRGNEKALGLNIAFNQERRDVLVGAAKRHAVTITPPLDLIQGYRAIIVYVPIYKSKPETEDLVFDGFIVGIFDLDKFLGGVAREALRGDVDVEIFDGDKLVFRRALDNSKPLVKVPTFNGAGIAQNFRLGNRSWDVRVWPNSEFAEHRGAAFPEILLIVSLLVSVMTGGAIYFAFVSRQNSRLLYSREKRHREIINQAIDGMITLSVTGHVQSVNIAAEKIFGRSTSEVQGQHILKLIPGLRQVLEASALLYKNQQLDLSMFPGGRQETWGCRRNGDLFPMELGLVLVELEQDEFYAAVVRDISERKLAEAEKQELLDNKNTSAEILRFLSQPALETREMAQGFLSILLRSHWIKIYSFGLVFERKGDELELIGESGASSDLVAEVLAESPVDWTQRNRDKGYRHFTLSVGEFELGEAIIRGEPELNSDPSQEFFLEGAFDILAITLQRQLSKAKIIEARDLAEQTTQLKSEFLANMSHEIRTPLNGVIGMTRLLSDTDLTPVQKRYLATVEYSADQLLSVVNDILDFSKIEAGHLEIESTEFDLIQLLRQVSEILNVRVQRDTIELYLDYPHQLPRRVVGDPVRLKQVLINLGGNAIKFTQAGFVRLSVEVVSNSQPDGQTRLRFEIEDTGIGIDQADIDAIFCQFAQADSSTTRNFGGTGLGLAISKQLVELQGGCIEVRSEVGVGSTFTFEIPFTVTEEPRHIPNQEQPCAVYVHCLRQRKFELISDRLREAGIVARQMNSGDLASQLTAESDSVVAIDCNRVGARITEFLLTTRANYPALKLLLFSLSVDDLYKIESAKINDVALAAKPFSSIELSATVQHLLKIGGIGDAENKDVVENSQTVSEQHGTVTRARPLNVLVVDDNKVNRMVAKAILKRENCNVDVAGNGLEAVGQFQEKEFDLILMDCQMPEMDGFEATRSIRSIEQERGLTPTPVIAFTANVLSTVVEKCSAAGMNGYLTKPVDRDALTAELHKWANR